MDSAQEQELINYLAGIGFSGEDFEKQLREKIWLNAPNFSLEHTILFEQQKVLFSLQFAKDQQFNAYKLDRYTATLRTAPEIEHAAINGIDTGRLEDSFKAANWNLYFNDPKALMKDDERQEIKALLSDLWQLTAKPSTEGKQVQDILQYKYWPEHAWDDSTKDLQRVYDRTQTFEATEYGICNTNLAFNILTERLYDLYEKLQVLEIYDFPIQEDLEKQLSGTRTDFDVSVTRNTPYGLSEYHIPIKLIDDFYQIETYKSSFTPYPPIEHGTYNGVDTAQLEQLMKQINWRDDSQLFLPRTDKEPEFTPKVNDVQEQMFRLSQDMVGCDIADKLQLKYWIGATFFEDMLQQSAWDLLQSLPKKEQDFPAAVSSGVATTLLAGRAVLNTPIGEMKPESNEWLRLDLQGKIDNRYPEVKTTGFSVKDVEEQLDLLPVDQSWYYAVRNSILRGFLMPAPLKNGGRLLIEANPEQRTLNLYTTDLRPIPANLRLDPDWKPQLPPVATEQKQERIQYHFKSARPIKKPKGKGL